MSDTDSDLISLLEQIRDASAAADQNARKAAQAANKSADHWQEAAQAVQEKWSKDAAKRVMQAVKATESATEGLQWRWRWKWLAIALLLILTHLGAIAVPLVAWEPIIMSNKWPCEALGMDYGLTDSEQSYFCAAFTPNPNPPTKN